jgi:protein ImuA
MDTEKSCQLAGFIRISRGLTMLEQLRQTLRALEKPALLEGEAGVAPFGIEAIDAVLGGGLARGALHEIAAASEAHVTAAAGFTLGLCAYTSSSWPGLSRPSTPFPRQPFEGMDARHKAGHDENIVWIAEDMALAESGVLHGGGLDAFGPAPERLIAVAAARPRDLLWAMEEALRCRAVRAVIGEWRHGAIDAVAVRRLSLAAAESGALAIVLRAAPAGDVSTAATRWIAEAAPSVATMHGPGLPRFAAHLMRNRRGPTGSWILEWRDNDERFCLAPAQPLAVPVLDRPHRQSARRVA